VGQGRRVARRGLRADYIGCAIAPGHCVEGDPLANAARIRQCESCIAQQLSQYSADWCGIDGYVNDMAVDIAGVLAAIEGRLLIKAGARGGAAWTGVGVLLLADGLVDMYLVFEGLDQMRAAAEQAKRDYCRCP
jgi:hypothetical protein